MIPSGYSRSVFSGHLPGGEIWQTGVWANEAPSDQSATQDQADAFAADFALYWDAAGGLGSINPGSVGADRVTVYSYLDNSGHATHVAESALSKVGSGSPIFPNQVTLCMTLLTSVAGRRARGRNYLPALKVTLDSNGEVASTQLSSLVGAWAGLINALNGELGDQRIGVLSQVGGTFQTATAVRGDSRLDIQRRRANSQTVEFTQTVGLS